MFLAVIEKIDKEIVHLLEQLQYIFLFLGLNHEFKTCGRYENRTDDYSETDNW